MKNIKQRIVAVILCLCMFAGMTVTAYAATGFSAFTSNTQLTVSNQPQTVNVTIAADTSISTDGLSFRYIVPEGWSASVVLAEKLNSFTLTPNDNFIVADNSADVTEVTDLAIITYTIPANAIGSFEVGATDLKVSVNGGDVVANGVSAKTTLTISDAPVNTGYQVYYEIEDIVSSNSDNDSYIDVAPGAEFNVGVYVKSTDSAVKNVQAFDIYPTLDPMLSYVSVADETGKGIVADEMSKAVPHFYSVAKDLDMTVDADGEKIATMTLKLSESAVYNTGYNVGLDSKTNMAVVKDAESVPVTVDTTAKGAETLKKVKVIFDTDSGSAVEEQMIGYNTSATRPDPNPTKNGYTFDNWYKEAAYTSVFDFAAPLTANETTVYAKWTANTVEVTLNANGGKFGSGETATDTKTVTETFDAGYVKTLAETPTRDGYTFAGWFDAATDGNPITADSKVDGTVTKLYAQWTANKYDVAYDLNGVTIKGEAPAQHEATYDVAFSLPSVEAEGWKFDGWKLGETTYTAGQSVSNLTTEKDATVTLVAQWSKNDYNITIADGIEHGSVGAVKEGAGTSANMGDKIIVTVTPDTGYEIGEVFYTPDGGTKTPISATEGVYSFTMPAANVTVSATFNAINYNITVAEGITNGTVSVVGNKTTAIVGEQVELNVVPAAGYKIDSVSYTTADGTTPIGVDENGKYILTMPAANVTVSAEFAPDNFTVTLNPNGGECDTTSSTVTYGGTYSALAGIIPTKTGYSFAGWFTAKDGGTEVKSTDTVNITSNTTLYAHWTAKQYTITFVTNGGTFADNSGVTEQEGKYTMTYTYGEAKTLPAISKVLQTLENWTVSYADGATEKGWGEAGAPINDKSSISDKYGDVTLTANWKENFTYKVEDYKYAPDGYVMLRIATEGNTNAYVFDSGENKIDMYYTDNSDYKLDGKTVFVTLIPKAGNVKNDYTLTTVALDKIGTTGAAAVEIDRLGKVNKDDVVNIADANAVYQMVIGGGKYYSMDQLETKNRLEADVDTAPVDTSEDNAEFRGSIADVHAIVTIINNTANAANG